MSDTPEGNICKVSANLGWASDTLAEVDKALLKLSAEVKTILRERDNFQDQRDFAMGEIERLRKERDEAREALTLATSEIVEQTFELRQQLGKAREALQKIASMAHGSADKTVCLIMLNGISRVAQAALKKEAAK